MLRRLRLGVTPLGVFECLTSVGGEKNPQQDPGQTRGKLRRPGRDLDGHPVACVGPDGSVSMGLLRGLLHVDPKRV
jgi:hypothetical protein